MADEIKKVDPPKAEPKKYDKQKWIQNRLRAVNKMDNPAKARTAAARILNNK